MKKMIKNSKVSVIMNCLNCEKYLREAIESVYAQTYKDWEIIFWDNGSTDNSGDIAKNYDQRLRYFRGEKAVPLGKARNVAIEKARGQYIAFLDCDDIWLPRKLEKQLPLFEMNQKVGLVYCDCIYFNDKGDRRRFYRNKRPSKGNVFKELLLNYFLAMPTVVVRKKALDGLDHWFDNRFNIYEEGDLFTRLCYSWQVDFVNEPLAKYRLHRNSWGFTKRNLWPKEVELMIAKYCNIYPSFKKECELEIKIIKSRINYEYAMLNWKQSRGSEARTLLRNYLKMDKKYMILYVISAFPYSIFKKLFELKRMYAIS